MLFAVIIKYSKLQVPFFPYMKYQLCLPGRHKFFSNFTKLLCSYKLLLVSLFKLDISVFLFLGNVQRGMRIRSRKYII